MQRLPPCTCKHYLPSAALTRSKLLKALRAQHSYTRTPQRCKLTAPCGGLSSGGAVRDDHVRQAAPVKVARKHVEVYGVSRSGPLPLPPVQRDACMRPLSRAVASTGSCKAVSPARSDICQGQNGFKVLPAADNLPQDTLRSQEHHKPSCRCNRKAR